MLDNGVRPKESVIPNWNFERFPLIFMNPDSKVEALVIGNFLLLFCPDFWKCSCFLNGLKDWWFKMFLYFLLSYIKIRQCTLQLTMIFSTNTPCRIINFNRNLVTPQWLIRSRVVVDLFLISPCCQLIIIFERARGTEAISFKFPCRIILTLKPTRGRGVREEFWFCAWVARCSSLGEKSAIQQF